MLCAVILALYITLRDEQGGILLAECACKYPVREQRHKESTLQINQITEFNGF